MRAAATFVVAVALGIGLAAASEITSDWAGRYERSFENGLVSGERYVSTDTLEIVRLDAQSAYVEASLQFYNGHECFFAGVFQADGESLVYRERETPDYREQCVLTITRANGQVVFEDANGACRQDTCGARGGYSGTSFPAASQRPMTEAELARASAQIADALREAGREP